MIKGLLLRLNKTSNTINGRTKGASIFYFKSGVLLVNSNHFPSEQRMYKVLVSLSMEKYLILCLPLFNPFMSYSKGLISLTIMCRLIYAAQSKRSRNNRQSSILRYCCLIPFIFNHS